MIELRELTKRYEDGVLALDHVSYTIQPGEIFCLLGANGAGKTTTVNILLDFIQPTSGSCFINGQDCNKFPLEAKKHVSYVSENVQLYGMFTARQNLRFFAELGGKKGLKNQELDNVMRSVGLPEKALTMRLKNYSKGMRQKLGIAIALIKDPPAIIMDEPTSGLDPRSANEFLDQLRKLREHGKAILMTTHDIFRAKQIADRVGIMKQGRLVAIRKRDEFKHADLEQIYLREMEAAESAA
ncbi:MAG: ABC transporter ATP-binding protein [Sedimentisphaerales bacterium]|nr:ABC transporter ATP-binding protein [Sedimentisphaerales bacterium]